MGSLIYRTIKNSFFCSTGMLLTMGHIQAVQRKIAFAALIHVRMEALAEKHLALTFAHATLDGVARTVQKVCPPEIIIPCSFITTIIRKHFLYFIYELHEAQHLLSSLSEVEVVKQFSGDGFLVFSPQLQTIQMPWFNSLSFRTREQFGLLMIILVGKNTSSIIEVSTGITYLIFS